MPTRNAAATSSAPRASQNPIPTSSSRPGTANHDETYVEASAAATTSGTAIVNLRLATTDRRKDREGNWTDHTEWHTIVAFGRQAENVNRFCKKGKQIFVEGRIQTRKWQDRDGNDKYTTEIRSDRIVLLGGRGGGGGADGGDHGSRAPSPGGGGGASGPPELTEDDIPF